MPNFDPYHKWLGIRPEEQPANHYRLLGLTVFEDDLDTISCAADQRMAHVRSFQAGSRSALSQQILNELAAARVCLLNPQKKAQYDWQLRQKMVVPPPPPAPTAMGPAGEASPGAPAFVSPVDGLSSEAGIVPVYKRHNPRVHSRKKWLPWVLPLVGMAAVAVLLVLIARQSPDENAEVAQQPGGKRTPMRQIERPQQSTSPLAVSPKVGAKCGPSAPTDIEPGAEPEKPRLNLKGDPEPLPPFEPPSTDEKPEPEKPERHATEPGDGASSDEKRPPPESDSLDVWLLTRVAPSAHTAGQHISVAKYAMAFAAEAVGENASAAARLLKQLARAETEKAKKTDRPGTGKPSPGTKEAKTNRGEKTRRGNGPDENSPAAVAISRGLDWLLSQQQGDGHWTFTTGPNPGNLGNSPCCATAMALLPLLRAGYSPRSGEHREAIDKGLRFLVGAMGANQRVGMLYEPGSRMYGQAICTLALCEVYARTRDRRWRDAAQAAVSFIVYAQDPKGGGWRYEPQRGGDTSVTGWQISALTAARNAKLQVPPITLVKANVFLNTVQLGGGASYSYEPGNGGSPATTAVGLLCRIHLGCKGHPALQTGISQVNDMGPSPDNIYFNFYGTQLMRHADADSWLKWRSKMCDQLLTAQSNEGDSQGSWFFPNGGFGTGEGGRLYFTSMTVMILQFCERDSRDGAQSALPQTKIVR